MKRERWIVLLLALAALPVLACGSKSEAATKYPAPARIEKIEGSDLSRVVLTEKAGERLGVATAPVQDAPIQRRGNGGTELRKVLPYAAVIYDPKGETWTYVSTAPLTYVRQRVVIDYIAGGLAVLTEGPPPGTLVVTVGASELYGVETGIGK